MSAIDEAEQLYGGVFFLGFIIGFVIMAVVWLFFAVTSPDYKDGQVDCANGIQNYEVVTHLNQTATWEKKK